MTCEIVKDLLPAYAAGECSDATRQAVEEHVATCASCAKSLRAMTEPAMIAETGRVQGANESGNKGEMDDPAHREELSKGMTFKKGFKKIRRRWLISILCVILIIPLSGLGYLGYNETRGEGYAFSNLSGLRNVDDFMKNFQNGDFEAVIEYFDIEPMYWEISREPDFFNGYIYPNDHRLIEIGGENYYTGRSENRSEFDSYKEPGTDAALWAQLIVENANGWKANLIPERVFPEAVRIAEKSLNEKIVIVDHLSEAQDSPYTYIRYYAQDGAVYYRPSKEGHLSEVDWLRADLIPESLFQVYVQINNREIDAIRETREAYRELGLERYTEMVKEQYITQMNELFHHGMNVKSYSVGKPYRRTESWNPITYYPYDEMNTYEKEYWYVDVAVLFSNEDSEEDGLTPIEYNQVFTFKMDGDRLTADGAYSMYIVKTGETGKGEIAAFYSVSISPSPYVLEEEPNRYAFYTDGIPISVWFTD